jgi:putative serine protease PepD
MQPGDVVLSFDGRDVDTAVALIVAVRSHEPGDEVSLTYQRDGEPTTVPVVLGSAEE